MKKGILILCIFITLCGCSNKPSSEVSISEEDNVVVETKNNDSLPTEEELKSYIKKIEISDDNWKDIFYVAVDYHEEVNNFGETVIDNEKIEAKLTVKDGYMADLSKIGLQLHDNLYGNDVVWENLDEDARLEVYYSGKLIKLTVGAENYHDDDIVYFVYNGKGFFTYDSYPFVMDNFTCTKAGGYVYKIEIPEEWIVDDDFYYKYVDYINSYGNACIFPLDNFEGIDLFMSE